VPMATADGFSRVRSALGSPRDRAGNRLRPSASMGPTLNIRMSPQRVRRRFRTEKTCGGLRIRSPLGSFHNGTWTILHRRPGAGKRQRTGSVGENVGSAARDAPGTRPPLPEAGVHPVRGTIRPVPPVAGSHGPRRACRARRHAGQPAPYFPRVLTCVRHS
jgi:hypothetical protein